MGDDYLRDAATPTQREPLDERQVPNSAGGYSYSVDVWTRLRRFLILGSEGGSYYASERSLTQQNIQVINEAMKEDGVRAVEEVVAISHDGTAPRQAPAIFALAYLAKRGDLQTRRAAHGAVGQVCRMSTQLFEFLGFCQVLGGHGLGRGLKRAIREWYSGDPEKLAYQLAKYRNREGWTHRDVLRMAKPASKGDPIRSPLFDWAVGRRPEGAVPKLIEGFERAQRSADPRLTAKLINDYGLTREMVKPEHLSGDDAAWVWEALLQRMPYRALIRNLSTMSRVGLLAPGTSAVGQVVNKLANGEALRKARIHPINVVTALMTYKSGQGFRSTWTPVPNVIDALDEAFYQSFDNIEPTGKRILIAVDCSSSMSGAKIGNTPLSCREAGAVMAMATARSESDYLFLGFTTRGGLRYGGSSAGYDVLSITKRQRLDDVVNTIARQPNGGTDIALPMIAAMAEGWNFDAFAIYTDHETWAGNIHPMEALRQYRREHQIPAKLATTAMVANGFSVADPDDAGALDVVGFDMSAPTVIGNFIADRV